MNEYLLKVAVKNAVKEALNADAPKFDNEGYLLDKNGSRFFVYNMTTADLIIKKYEGMGIRLIYEKIRGDFYFKRSR